MNKTVIYIEGPDCAGKTTLVSAIQREGDLVVHNGVYPTPAIAYQTYIDQLEAFKESSHKRLILDRGVLSEIVYGLVMRDNKPDELQYKRIVDLLESFQTYHIVMCLPPFGRTVMKWAQRQEEEYVNQFEKFVMIYNYFRELAIEDQSKEIIVHDYTHNHNEVVNYVNR